MHHKMTKISSVLTFYAIVCLDLHNSKFFPGLKIWI